MTVLSNRAILEALDSGRLLIDPRPQPDPGPRDSPYDAASVELRLSPEIYVPRKDLDLNFDLQGRGVAETLETVYRRDEVPETGWPLRQNEFILGSTIETIELPLGEGCLAARIEGRSSFARTGLLVHFTAPTIHPGFRGAITLEVINLGEIPVTLRPGIRLCQLIVETVEGSPVRSESRFQGQARASGSASRPSRWAAGVPGAPGRAPG